MIRDANARAGFHFFSRDTMRFFASRIERPVYQGPGGIFFVTSEQQPTGRNTGPEYHPRRWQVRQFNPATGDIVNNPHSGRFQDLDRTAALAAARLLARGHNPTVVQERLELR
jgi:hypothetical protein